MKSDLQLLYNYKLHILLDNFLALLNIFFGGVPPTHTYIVFVSFFITMLRKILLYLLFENGTGQFKLRCRDASYYGKFLVCNITWAKNLLALQTGFCSSSDIRANHNSLLISFKFDFPRQNDQILHQYSQLN